MDFGPKPQASVAHGIRPGVVVAVLQLAVAWYLGSLNGCWLLAATGYNILMTCYEYCSVVNDDEEDLVEFGLRVMDDAG